MKPEYYKCTNNKCIASVFVCDKENDCLDGSDENHCHDVRIKFKVKKN